MKSIIALALACFASGAFAQVGLGGGVVGTLGASGAASSIGGLGSGISTGATSRGAEVTRSDVRTNSQTGSTVQTPAAGGSVSTSIDAKANGSGIRADSAGGASASAGTPSSIPLVSGSAWGSAEAGVNATTPDAKETVRDTKAAARQKADKLESRRDKIEDKGDKTVDKALQ